MCIEHNNLPDFMTALTSLSLKCDSPSAHRSVLNVQQRSVALIMNEISRTRSGLHKTFLSLIMFSSFGKTKRMTNIL